MVDGGGRAWRKWTSIDGGWWTVDERGRAWRWMVVVSPECGRAWMDDGGRAWTSVAVDGGCIARAWTSVDDGGRARMHACT